MDHVIVAQKLEAERANVQRTLNSVKFRLDRLIESYSHMSRSLAVAQAFETDSDFQTLAQLLRNNNPGVVNIARSQNFVITDVHPIEPNRAALGYDYRDDAKQLESVQKAIDTQETVIVGPIELFQGGRGLLLRNAQPGPGNIVGNIVLDFDWLLKEAGMNAEPNVFMSSARIKNDENNALLFGSPSVWATDPVLTEVLLGDVVLELAKMPTNGWKIDKSHRFVLIMTTTLIVVIALFGVNYARRLIIERAQARRQLMNAIDSIHDGFVIFDRNDRLVMCNDKFRELFRASREKIVPGVSFEAILRDGVERGQYPEANGCEEEWIAERLALHANPTGQTEVELANGSWIKASESKTSDGSTVGIRTDITELKRALHAAEQAITAKTEFINNMNHELRAPLSVVLGYIAFLKNVALYPQYQTLRRELGNDADLTKLLDDFTDVVVGQAAKSEASGKHLLGLINSVLDWAKLNSESVVLNTETVELDKLLNSLADEFGVAADEKGLQLRVEADPVSIHGDPMRLRQIFVNLLNNAIKFTDSGFINISVLNGTTSVKVVVEDSGQGIPEDQLGLVFDRFKQVAGKQQQGQSGTGLGLAITKNLVELHGGQISVSSTLGQGSKFEVILMVDFTLSNERAAVTSGNDNTGELGS